MYLLQLSRNYYRCGTSCSKISQKLVPSELLEIHLAISGALAWRRHGVASAGLGPTRLGSTRLHSAQARCTMSLSLLRAVCSPTALTGVGESSPGFLQL